MATNQKTAVQDSYSSLNELRNFIDSIHNARDKLIVKILYETGCSLTELINVKACDIAGNTVKINSTDNNSIRFPKISGKLAKDLSLFIIGNKLRPDSHLFTTRQSKGISEKRIRQLIQHYSISLDSGIINPHKIRYYHILHAYQSGVFIENISKQLGITTFRIFQVLRDFGLKPEQNYSFFLRRV